MMQQCIFCHHLGVRLDQDFLPFMIQDNQFKYESTGSHKKKWQLLKNPTKIEEIQEKIFIDRN
jgi:hypothetical protein